jgi:pyruvate dehydrogenase E2 component (dihydrolipoamide acetyltransferase)
MPTSITMPALSPTMEEGNLAKWHVKVGDKVKPGDVIAEIETDKATMEVEAVDEGVISKLLVEEGAQGVKVNAVIAELDGGEMSAGGNGAAPVKESAKAEQVAKSGPPAAKVDAARKSDSDDPRTSAAAEERASSPPSRSGGDGPSRSAGTEGASRPAASPQPGQRLRASPLARRLASRAGVDLKAIPGSGPHGRIIKADVEKASRSRPAQAPPAPGAPPNLIEPAVLDDRVYPPDSYELVPLDNVRRVTARRLTQSFMQVPHFPLTIDLEIDHLLAARKAINATVAEDAKISVNDMLIKAAALALIAQPDANASFTDKGIARHKAAHVSMAVAIEGGLITPVIRDAEKKGLAQIAAETKDLARRARERKLKPHEYLGGTFSISNLGMFGVREFGSILNPPEGMILSVGEGSPRAVVKDGQIVAATVLTVTLTCDHRVVDGATGARWLSHFRRFVETPESMLL